MKIAIFGSCQVGGISRCLRAMAPKCEVFATNLGVHPNLGGSIEVAKNCDVIIYQTHFRELLNESGVLDSLKDKYILSCPTWYFPAFHPDLVYIGTSKGVAKSPMSDYQSSIIFYAWTKGLSVDHTEALFCEPIFEHLGFFNFWETSKQALLSDMSKSSLDLEGAFDRWAARGCFAYSVNHPKLFVLSSIAEAILGKLGISPTPLPSRPEECLPDELSSLVWPVYPAIAVRLGLKGNYVFKVSNELCLTLREYIEGSFKCYNTYSYEELHCSRIIEQSHLYRDIEEIAASMKRKSVNPYSGLPDYCFWRKGVAKLACSEVDPVVRTKFKLAETDRIATAGSCFAQHIASTLVKNGYNYYVTEAAPEGMSTEQAAAGSYGLFSARYGNIYTARQLLQLLDRAYGWFTPRDISWIRRDGRYIDPFRPQVETDGFSNEEAIITAREEHFAAVRRMFETMDVCVFTLGLTEAWRAKSDGAVFPVVPGVVATGLNETSYEFVNFKAAEIHADMRDCIAKLQAVNSRVRIILTVSPVPLVATYEQRHVLVSTTYSKSALRTVAGEIADELDYVDYFPSYEIITGNFNRGRYFGDDLREVKPEGIEHVMRLFSKHYYHLPTARKTDEKNYAAPDHVLPIDRMLHNEIDRCAKVLCDEELLDPP